MGEILSVRHLSKSFGRNKILDQLNMTLDEGKVYGLLGKNGAGKTTLIKILMGVIPRDRGEVIYKNKKITYNNSLYKREIGYIPEDPYFFSWMTIKGLLNLNSSFYPTWNSKIADVYLEQFSLDKKAKIKHLSRGMKLKLGLVVALASEPEFLILDDPTSGLDVPTRQEFLKDIIREFAEAGTTILFSTHLVHEIEGIIDHLSILHQSNFVVDEDFEKIKRAAKKIRMTFETTLPEKISIEGILTEKKDDNMWEMVVYPWDKHKEKKVEELAPANLEIETLSLEDVFISFVS